MIKLKNILRETEEFQQLPSELKKHFLEIISKKCFFVDEGSC